MVKAVSSLRRDWSRRRRSSPDDLAELGVDSPLLAQLLLNRGITTPADAQAFLEPPRPVAPALSEMAGLDAAVQRIERALTAGQKIVVYGDYDVDGLSGSTVLERTLLALGGRAEVFIPHRDRDGYGLNSDVLRALSEQEAGLVITVDCGVTAAAEVAVAGSIGLDIVVTDHHDVPAVLPEAVAVVNPHRPDCPYPFTQLAGAGVALKVAQALIARRLSPAGAATLEPALFQLAALGTVSDVMPLVGENRAIVRHGLRALNQRPIPGLAALVRRAGLTRPWVDAEDIAFRLGPRLNAAGRISEASVTQRLLATRDPAEAERLADQLEALNSQRRELADAALDDARASVLAAERPGSPADRPAAPAVVVQSSYPSGVLGLVAVRLVEETGRAVAVLERTDGMSRGSVRVPEGLSAIEAVSACAEYLLRYGGHRGAAGFAIEASQIDAFSLDFVAAFGRQSPVVVSDDGPVADCRLRPSTISEELLDLLARLGPFGQAAPEPLFETGPLVVREARVVKERHLRLKLSGERRLLVAIGFNGAAEVPRVGSEIDVLYRARPNVWQGERRAELDLAGWRPSSA
ncbi:MAG: single-stranded-DNA-specific exonuclease RecJ [Chloroflexota bacterium]